jgi:hypothetical protein
MVIAKSPAITAMSTACARCSAASTMFQVRRFESRAGGMSMVPVVMDPN